MERNVSKIKSVTREVKKELSKLYGPRLIKLVLYGSYARNEAEEDSDIDLLTVLEGKVELGKEIERTSELCYEVLDKYSVVLSILPITLRDYMYYDSPVMMNIRKEAVAI